MTRVTRQAPPAYLDRYKESLVEETASFIHAYDKAHVLMLGERGILPAQTALALLDGLVRMDASDMEGCRRSAGGGNHAGERHLSAQLGLETGGAIGLARSSGDLSAVAFRMLARDRLGKLQAGLLRLRRALVAFAERHRDAILPGNTHGQHAQPITFALWAMMFETALTRDGARLAELNSRIDRCPAGAGIMSGTDFPIDRSRLADLLGFAGLAINTLDAALSHDLEIEFASALNLACHTLSRMGEDLLLWCTTEYALIELSDRFVGTSSLMPQKRNPNGVQDLRNLTAQAQACLGMVMATERGPTGFPMIERRNSDRMLRELTEALLLRLGALPELLDEMVVNTRRAEESAEAHWSTVTDLAGAVVAESGIPWRQAHGLVAGFVGDSIAKGLAPADCDAAAFRTYADRHGLPIPALSEAAFRAALSARAFVARRNLPGGPGPAAMDAVLAAARTRLHDEQAALEQRIDRLARADAALDLAVRQALEAGRFG